MGEQHSFLLVHKPPWGVQPLETGTHVQVEKSNCSPVPQAAETHAPPQKTKPLSHWHAPFTQLAFAGHALPQKPQFVSSLATHMPLQNKSPEGHWHVPFTQVVPAGHVLPQKPQFVLSLVTHWPLQKKVPDTH